MVDRLRLERSARKVVHATRRVRDTVLGPDETHWKRLVKQGRVVVGQGTYGIPTVQTYLYGTERLVAGSYCSLNGTFVLGGKHAVDRVTTYPLRINLRLPGAGEDGYPTPTGDTVVGSDVWTCFGALISSGVTIGDGAIVAGGAVVVRDVPPFAIVGGNPAQVIRYRFTEEQREALLEIKWWDWSEDEVRAAAPYLSAPDIDAFIDYARLRQ